MEILILLPILIIFLNIKKILDLNLSSMNFKSSPGLNFKSSPPMFKGYELHGVKKNISNEQIKLQNKNYKFLKSKGVLKDKVRFVLTPCFTYNISNNEINPEHRIKIPIMDNGLIDRSTDVIDLDRDKNESTIMICVLTYENINWELLSYKINNSIKGFVFFIHEKEKYLNIFGEESIYSQSCSDYRIRYINLDEEILKHSSLILKKTYE